MRTILMFTVLTILVLSFFGCAVVSKDLRVQSDPSLSYAQVKTDPVHYAGEIVIWGGYIIENQAGQNLTRLIVLQAPLAFNQEPKSRDASRGRYIAMADHYLDPEVYSKDRPVTIAGTIADQTQSLKDDAYGAYPVVRILEIHLWDKPSDENRFWRYGPYSPWYGPPYVHPRFYYGHTW